MFGLLALAPLAACQHSGVGPRKVLDRAFTPPRDTDGPYRDLDAAVRFAAPQVDMAIMSANARDPALWRYTLLTTRDEEVTLDIHLPSPPPDPNSPIVPTSIVAHVGRFGDPARERALIQQIDDRLKALRKTGIAPDPDG